MERKRKVRAVIENVHLASAEDLIKSDTLKQLLMTETPSAIENAIQTKNVYATIFEINDSSSYVEVHKRDWVSALESCLKYQLEKENYELCSKINSLINRIKAKSSLTIKKDKNE